MISRTRRALVVGAGGYLGTSIVRRFVDEGWEVRGLVRSPASAARVERASGTAIAGDVLDFDSVSEASRGCQLLVHVAATGSSGTDGLLRAARVRVEGCRNLLRAARTRGVTRLVIGSGYWVYADQAASISEDSPLDPRGESLINFETESIARDPSLRGATEVVIVRPGMVYGNGSWCRSTVEAIREGTYSYVGDGSNPWSFVSLEDVGSGFLRVAEEGRTGEVYNLVDGRPARWREFGDWVAERLGRPAPPSVALETATVELGPDVAHHLRARRACSAAKMGSLGWKPRFADFRAGMPAILDLISRERP